MNMRLSVKVIERNLKINFFSFSTKREYLPHTKFKSILLEHFKYLLKFNTFVARKHHEAQNVQPETNKNAMIKYTPILRT